MSGAVGLAVGADGGSSALVTESGQEGGGGFNRVVLLESLVGENSGACGLFDAAGIVGETKVTAVGEGLSSNQ